MAANCGRCGTTLRRARSGTLGRGLALNIAALVLLLMMCASSLMTVEKAGIVHAAGLLSGPAELVRRGMPELAVVVVFTTLAAPFARLLGTIYVLLELRGPQPPWHLRRVFAWVERLGPWAMLDVFVFGVFVAYVKLGNVVSLSLDIGVYSLLALTFVKVWADATLDRHAIWEALGRADPRIDEKPLHLLTRLDPAHAVGCLTCSLVSEAPTGAERCPRCDSALHVRKPDAVGRTWALLIGAAILYGPANWYPVLTVVQLGAGRPSTIIGGVGELFKAGMYPLGILVLVASVAVPLLKMVGLSAMLIMIQTGNAARLRERTHLYHVIQWIGRWSMIDIFMESLLGALVRFGAVITIAPGFGAVAFCGVVVLTMLAAETFDPRLMWDRAARLASNEPGRYSPGWSSGGRSSALS